MSTLTSISSYSSAASYLFSRLDTSNKGYIDADDLVSAFSSLASTPGTDAGDLFTHTGHCPALTESDCVAPALEAEAIFHATGLTTNLAPTLEQLAALNPSTLALMHGSSYTGDGAAQLRALADGYAAMAV